MLRRHQSIFPQGGRACARHLHQNASKCCVGIAEAFIVSSAVLMLCEAVTRALAPLLLMVQAQRPGNRDGRKSSNSDRLTHPSLLRGPPTVCA